MKISKFRFFDHNTGWSTNNIQLDTVNLLVGASGVGKTRLLNAITQLKNIALGEAATGYEWDVEFLIQGKQVAWSGAYPCTHASPTTLSMDLQADDPESLVEERLTLDGHLLAARDGNTLLYLDDTLPVLQNPELSLLSLLNPREGVKQIVHTFMFEYPNYDWPRLIAFPTNYLAHFDHQTISLMKIRFFRAPGLVRLFLLQRYFPDHYDRLWSIYRDIFPRVTEARFRIGPVANPENIKSREGFLELSFLIREEGVRDWVHHRNLSDGMWKTLHLLLEHHLSPNQSLIMIDEVENSLGINCIEVLGELMDDDSGHQFILTSHHPYIINNIPMSHWKIVTREEGVVTLRPALDYGLGRSKHEAFMELLQLEAFNSGVSYA